MKSKELLDDFVAYCTAHPEYRFWQALRNWSGYFFIFVGESADDLQDTFYWNQKDKF